MLYFGLLRGVKSLSLRSAIDHDLTYAKSVSITQFPGEVSSNSSKWHIAVETDSLNITVDLRESWRFNNIIAAFGSVYPQSIQINDSLTYGNARFTLLLKDNNDIVVQGFYEIDHCKYHLYWKHEKYTILHEKSSNSLSLQGIDTETEKSKVSIQVNSPRGELISHNSITKRDIQTSDSQNAPASIWPTFHDLMEIGNNGTTCYSTLHSAPIGIAADSNFMDSFESTDAAQLHIIDTINKASQIWENAFNISLQLSEMILGNSGVHYSWDIPCNSSENSVNSLESRLTILKDWRINTHLNDNLALWSLFSNCPSSDVIGLAWQSSACEPSGSNIVHHSLLDYQIFAHECGHVFGAVHDCINTTCSGKIMDNSQKSQLEPVCCPYSSSTCDSSGKYIMSPGSDILQQSFSRCTQGNICAAISNLHVNSSCLVKSTSVKPNIDIDCTRETDSVKYRQCWRDAQCWSITNEKSQTSCGTVNDCTLSCVNHENNKCEVFNVPLSYQAVWGLNDGIRNSSCINTYTPGTSLSSSKVPVWGWAILGIFGVSGVLLILAMILLAALKLKERRNSIKGHTKSVKEMNTKGKSLKIGSPTPERKIINRNPINGIRPILPYNNSPNTSYYRTADNNIHSPPSSNSSSSSSYPLEDDKDDSSLNHR